MGANKDPWQAAKREKRMAPLRCVRRLNLAYKIKLNQRHIGKHINQRFPSYSVK